MSQQLALSGVANNVAPRDRLAWTERLQREARRLAVAVGSNSPERFEIAHRILTMTTEAP